MADNSSVLKVVHELANITREMKQQNKALEAINANLVEAVKRMPKPVTIFNQNDFFSPVVTPVSEVEDADNAGEG